MTVVVPAYARNTKQNNEQTSRMAKAHHGNSTSCNRNSSTGSSTGIIEIGVYEVQDNHEVGDFVLHVFGFLNFHVHHCTARLNVYETG